MTDVVVKIDSVTKRFGNAAAVDDLSLEVEEREFLTLLGPSGCGKTTTLRMVAGFLHPDTGHVLIRGERVDDKAPYERNLAMVFQNYALFPHMTVRDNLGFGLRMRKIDCDTAARIAETLDLVRLGGVEDRYPRELSGGQQQRVALARAIITTPDVLLLDEPLSNLDLKLREQMRVELKSIQRKTGVTSIYVTHDQVEALVMSDRVVVMDKGKITQAGRPSEIYDHPANKFTADFIGETNFFNGKIVGIGDYVKVATERGLLINVSRVPLGEADMQIGQAVHVCIRPHRIAIKKRKTQDVNSYVGTVEQSLYAGSIVKYIVRVGENRLVVEEPTTTRVSRNLEGEVFVECLPENWDIVPE
jgi:ABC-type Fe3+/spermidine/putrescine transport system ATPase subunit